MRGQTTLDFATGISVFLFVLLFVFLFVPGTLEPFTGSAQEETAASDRIADVIVKDVLAEDGRPYLLNGTCTAHLLSDAAAPGCDFDGATLEARLDLTDRQTINVTVRSGDDEAVQCWDASAEDVVPASDAACDTEYAAGPSPPENSRSTVSARRIVRVGETIGVVEVRMW